MAGKYDNNGALFKNTRKQEENQPDYNGSATVDGVEYYMNAWMKTSKAGQPYMSFSFKKKTDQGESGGGGTEEAEGFF